MAERRRNSPTDKHFQNGQRRHKENEAESNMGRGCRRTEEHNVSLLQPRRGFTESVRFDVSTERLTYGHIGNYDGTPRYLPNPYGIDREFLISLQRYPEHLREILLFNRISTQRSHVSGGNNSESNQYETERRKEMARIVLTQIADELRAQGVILEEKMVDRILESLGKLDRLVIINIWRQEEVLALNTIQHFNLLLEQKRR